MTGSACGDSNGETNSSECCEHKLLSHPRISKELGLVKLSGRISTDSEMCLLPKIYIKIISAKKQQTI